MMPRDPLRKGKVKVGLALVLATVLSGVGLSGQAGEPRKGAVSGMGVTGGAAGGASEAAASDLEHCDSPYGTVAVVEDQATDWWSTYRSRYPQLGSTIPLIRLMIQQSNCFVVVERGQAMGNLMQERELERSGELREGSGFGKGQMVAADYTISPSIQFAEKGTSGLGGALGGLIGGTKGRVLGAIAGGVKTNEAATTLLLVDNRSSVQIAAATGNAKNVDLKLGVGLFGSAAVGVGGFTDTPEGKVITAAFVDAYNQMVRALRNYRAQTVEGGLGKGGRLGVGD
ncbi:MAG: hypothetical protein KatS3mg124_1092 [Porticoccaceae bacterium]|nr:MAG: hypothetical protein KatS3mg124_1092 [Porticoccaceae bacterium]